MRPLPGPPHLLKPSAPRMLLNGSPPTVADLQGLVLANYGHFTTFQYGNGGVPGLSLHLARLDVATQTLFGSELPEQRVRADLQLALDGCATAMVRINVFSRALNMRQLETAQAPDLLITVLPLPVPAAAPLRVRTVRHQRYLPEIKHAGTFNLFHQRREARRAGFDDALFVDDQGKICEGSIWNIGFWDGKRVLWPEAPALHGVSMQLLSAQLEASGIAVENRPLNLADLPHMRCAFFTNAAIAVEPIASIDGQTFGTDADFYERLYACSARVPWEPL